jgi:hypothetical protein
MKTKNNEVRTSVSQARQATRNTNMSTGQHKHDDEVSVSADGVVVAR